MIPMIIMAIEDEDDRSFMANLYVDYQRLMYKVITSHTTGSLGRRWYISIYASQIDRQAGRSTQNVKRQIDKLYLLYL